MTNLKDRAPAHSLLKRLRQEMSSSPGENTRVNPSHAQSWYDGILGELEVARLLDTLPVGWLVLHSVPVGDRGSDIDHVVISPGGRVMTINTKRHPGAKVWAGEHAILVNGHRQAYLPIARSEAARATDKLGRAIGQPVEVDPFIVFVGSRTLTIKQQPAGVTLATTSNLVWLLELAGREHSAVAGEAVRRAAAESTTWSRQPLDSDSSAELIVWFMSMRQPNVPSERSLHQRPLARPLPRTTAFYQPRPATRGYRKRPHPLKILGIIAGASIGSLWVGGMILGLLAAASHGS